MYIFASFNGLKGQDLSWAVMTSMGNMGFAKAVCSNALINWTQSSANLMFTCENTTKISNVLSSGIVD